MLKKLSLSYQVQDLSLKNKQNQRTALKSNKINMAAVKLRKTLKSKRRKIRILTNNLTAMKTELETLCLHIYKMDSMLVTATMSMEQVLKVIQFKTLISLLK